MTYEDQIDQLLGEYISLLGSSEEYNGLEFKGFCMAKRAQKVIEIEVSSPFGTDVLIAIEKAGYQYTIKGE